MKLHYYPDTDSLYIDLSERVSADSREIAPGVVLDFDAEGNLVGIDIDRASRVASPSRLEIESFPIGGNLEQHQGSRASTRQAAPGVRGAALPT